jgi:hypothetical protein
VVVAAVDIQAQWVMWVWLGVRAVVAGRRLVQLLLAVRERPGKARQVMLLQSQTATAQVQAAVQVR